MLLTPPLFNPNFAPDRRCWASRLCRVVKSSQNRSQQGTLSLTFAGTSRESLSNALYWSSGRWSNEDVTPFHRETCVCCRSRWFTSFWRNTGRVAVDITVRLQLLIILSNSPKILYLSCSFSADVLECLSITNRPIHSFYFLLIHDWYLVAVARRRHRRPRPRPRKWCIMQHAVSCYAPHRYIGLTSIKPELMFIFLAKNLKEVFGILCRRSFVYVSGRLYVFRIKVLLLATANSRILTYVVLLSVVWYVTKILVIVFTATSNDPWSSYS